jgi:hypothetical protein
MVINTDIMVINTDIMVIHTDTMTLLTHEREFHRRLEHWIVLSFKRHYTAPAALELPSGDWRSMLDSI